MDIKDFILIVGSLLIVLVIVHGFWSTWRARREPLKIDITWDIIPDEDDEMARFRGELPNGGARPACPEQINLELESPQILEPTVNKGGATEDFVTADGHSLEDEFSLQEEAAAREAAKAAAREALDVELLGERSDAALRPPPPPRTRRAPQEPDLFTIPEGYGPDMGQDPDPAEPASRQAANGTAVIEPTVGLDPAPQRPRVIDVTLEDSDAWSTEPRQSSSSATDRAATDAAATDRAANDGRHRQADRAVRAAEPAGSLRPRHKPIGRPGAGGTSAGGRARRQLGKRTEDGEAAVEPLQRGNSAQTTKTEVKAEAEAPEAEEFIMIYLLAPRGQHFEGRALLEQVRAHRLKLRELSIFHRIDPKTDKPLFSLVNLTKPGFFDLSTLPELRTPGVTLFLRLPGPPRPAEVFDEMLQVACAMAESLGGELRDETRSLVTRQSAAHMRQRICDFALKRYSRNGR